MDTSYRRPVFAWLALGLAALLSLPMGLGACDKGDEEGEGEESEYTPPPDPGADLPQYTLEQLFALDQPYPSPIVVTQEAVAELPMGRHMSWGEVPAYKFRLPNHPTENAFDWRDSECLYQAREGGEWNVSCTLRADPNQTTGDAFIQSVVEAARAKYGEPSEQSEGMFGTEYTWRLSDDGRTRLRVFAMDASDWGALQVHAQYSRL